MWGRELGAEAQDGRRGKAMWSVARWEFLVKSAIGQEAVVRLLSVIYDLDWQPVGPIRRLQLLAQLGNPQLGSSWLVSRIDKIFISVAFQFSTA